MVRIVLALLFALCLSAPVQAGGVVFGGFRTPVRNALAFGFAPRVVVAPQRFVAPLRFQNQFFVPQQRFVSPFVQPLNFGYGFGGVQQLNFGYGGGFQQLNVGGVGACLVH